MFGEKSFAILVLVLMFFPALPLPTGGITHVFEVIVMLLALEMIIGRKTIWLPKWAKEKELGQATQKKIVPFIIRRIRWFERFSRRRSENVVRSESFSRLAGLVFFVLALGAALALPFSGLDTLPALGAVVVALSLILDDIALFFVGLLIGVGGIILEFALGAATIEAIKHFF